MARCVWASCPPLATATPSGFRARLPSSNAAKMPGVGREHGHGASGLRAVAVRRWRMRVLLLPQDASSIDKWSPPVELRRVDAG
jgi:hypothetical protein